jgi:phosphoglycolate phosphatase-like HAD superfamily hydrolase
MQAAKAAGCPRILVRSGHGAEAEKAGWPETLEPLLVVDDLPAAVTHILQHYAGA